MEPSFNENLVEKNICGSTIMTLVHFQTRIMIVVGPVSHDTRQEPHS